MSTFMSSCPDSQAKSKPKGAEHLSQLIGNAINNLSGKERLGEEEIERAWRAGAGGAAAKHSRPVSFKKGSLIVDVASSSWLYELTIRKAEILKTLERELKVKKIKELRFRIGDISIKEIK